MQHPGNFTVLTPTAFIEDVEKAAEKATHRAWAQAMDAEPGEVADRFFRIFLDAAARGIDTRFHVDSYTNMATDGYFHYWPFLPPRLYASRKKKIAAKKRLAAEFREAGVRFLYTNPPTTLDRIFPVRGRNHMKIVIVDDVAWIGGVNFLDFNFAAMDIMVRLTDPAIVQEVVYLFNEIDLQHELRDMAIDCTDETKLLVDGGRINRSLILRHTVELVDQATSRVQVVSPLIPDADLLAALKRALKRGVTVEVIAPQSTRMEGVFVLLDEYNGFMMRLKGGQLPIQFKPRMIHAKILIVDNREAIVGSHNLSSRGVRMGTEEIALRSTDPTLVHHLQTFYQSLTTL